MRARLIAGLVLLVVGALIASACGVPNDTVVLTLDTDAVADVDARAAADAAAPTPTQELDIDINDEGEQLLQRFIIGSHEPGDCDFVDMSDLPAFDRVDDAPDGRGETAQAICDRMKAKPPLVPTMREVTPTTPTIVLSGSMDPITPILERPRDCRLNSEWLLRWVQRSLAWHHDHTVWS